MNRYLMVGVAVVAMLAAGCEDPVPPVEIRLHAENTAGFEFLNLEVKDVRVYLQDKEIPVKLGGRTGDLLNPANSPLLGTVRIPESAREVRVVVRLDDYGAFATANEAGYINVKGAPIEFTSPIKALRLRDHVVVHLDVNRSLVSTGRTGERVLLPNLNVRH